MKPVDFSAGGMSLVIKDLSDLLNTTEVNRPMYIQ